MTNQFQVGVAIGSGLTAHAAERAGADFLLAINAGRIRNMGAPSVASILPIIDATELTIGFAKTEVLSQVTVPVYLGVSLYGHSNDPQEIAQQAASHGFAGIVNFPTSIHFSSSMQRILTRANRGIEQEVAVLEAAKKLGLKTILYCANRSQARMGADAGLDKILLNFGWNSGGEYGHKKKLSLEEVAIQTRETARLVKRINPEVSLLLEGGPIVTAKDLSFIAQKVEFDGYIGGSTIDRLPMESTITDLIASYRIAGEQRIEVTTDQRKLLSWGRQRGAAGSSRALIDCLKHLNKLVTLKSTAYIQHETGVSIHWVTKAFENHYGDDSVQSISFANVSGKTETVASISTRLFGSLKQGKHQPGLLNDSRVKLILVHAPEQLLPRIQNKLATAINAGKYVVSGSHKKQTVAARCVFFSECSAEQNLPDNLIPELAELARSQTLVVPPLRQRSEDIPALLAAYFDKIGLREDKQPDMNASALQQLKAQEWTGNETALYAVADRLALFELPIDKTQVDLAITQHHKGDVPNLENTRSEKARIVETLWRYNFHKGRTAEALGITRKTLYNKIKRYGL